MSKNHLHTIPSYCLFILIALTSIQSAAQPVLQSPARSGLESFSTILSLPRDEAIATALQPEHEEIRPGVLNIVFRKWAIQDPQGAYTAYKSLPALDYDYLIETQILQNWLRVDLETALELAANSENEETFGLVLRDAAYINPNAALAIARHYESIMDIEDWRSVIEGIASNEPYLAAEQVALMNSEGEYLIESFIYHLARQDIVASIQWLLQNSPDNVQYFESIASIFYIQDANAAFEYVSRIPSGPARDAYEQALLKAQKINEASSYRQGTPYWIPMIDTCMNIGVSRNECIKSLPSEALEDLEKRETTNAENRRNLIRNRSN